MKFEFDYQCDREWDEMKGGDRRRFCDSCDKHVHHISSMTEDQARKFLEDRDYDVCVDFFADATSGETQFREKEARFQGQLDGLKQLMASALAVVPLALGAAFVDFDEEPEIAEVVRLPIQEVDPVELAGPEPVIVNTTSNFDLTPPPIPVVEPDPVVEEAPELPIIPQAQELDPKPIIKPPKIRLRGKIARPTNWPDPLTDI